MRGLTIFIFSQSETCSEIDERKSHWLHFRWRNTKLDTTARWGGEQGVIVQASDWPELVIQPSDWLVLTLPDSRL